jgi:hypothetical protein
MPETARLPKKSREEPRFHGGNDLRGLGFLLCVIKSRAVRPLRNSYRLDEPFMGSNLIHIYCHFHCFCQANSRPEAVSVDVEGRD